MRPESRAGRWWTKNRPMGVWLFVFLFVTIASASAQPAVSTQREVAPALRELVVVVPEDVITVDPARYQRHSLTESVHRLLYRRLLSRQGNEFGPNLAYSVEALDELTWRFEISPGLRTPDGRAYGAQENRALLPTTHLRHGDRAAFRPRRGSACPVWPRLGRRETLSFFA